MEIDYEGKQERIKLEVKRLKGLYTKIGLKEKKLIEGLILDAAYMRITLDDYKEDLDQHGYTEPFTQSPNTKPYDRERPVARLYNTMNKNYQSIMKQLSDMLPKQAPKQEDDGFEGFCKE